MRMYLMSACLLVALAWPFESLAEDGDDDSSSESEENEPSGDDAAPDEAPSETAPAAAQPEEETTEEVEDNPDEAPGAAEDTPGAAEDAPPAAGEDEELADDSGSSDEAEPTAGEGREPYKPVVGIELFTHLQLVVAHAGETVTPSFQLGDINLLARASLTPQVDALGEGIFEILPDRGANPLLGRLWARATVSPALRILGGRFHTPIGSVVSKLPAVVGLYGLFPTMPRLLATRTSVSMVHARMDGAQVSGEAAMGSFGTFAYDIAGGWAHGGKPTAVGRFSIAPGGKVEGLKLGGSFSIHRGASSAHDGVLSLDQDAQDVAQDIYSMMVVGNVSYKGGPVIGVVEAYYVRNSEEAFADEADELIAVWALLGIKIKTVTPFARYEWWTRDAQDNFYNLGGAPADWSELTVGVNCRISPKVVAKVAYLHGFHDDSNKGLVQLALGF